MVALTKGRTTPQRVGDTRSGLVAAAAVIFQGAIVMRNAAGELVQGQAAANLVGVGMALSPADNADGAAGDLVLAYAHGRFHFANSTGGDEITAANIGDLAFVLDDQTVAATNGGGTRSPAGFIEDVDAQGVWVVFDEFLTNAAS